MIYNILVIDNMRNHIYYENNLESIEDIDIEYIINEDILKASLLTQKIDMIILNYDYIKLEVIEKILKDSSFDYLSLPILVENGDILYDDFKNSVLLYDLVNFKDELEISLNKLKFCKSLYQKELKHRENIQHILYIDTLTKFPNREKFIYDLKENKDNIKSIAIIDIQDFKTINDFYGLKIGDSLLKKIAYLIDETIKFVKPKVILYKFSSDLYCLKNKSLEKNEFEELVIFVLGAIDSEIFKEGEYNIDIKASAGITFSSKKNKLITADLALQYAKKHNKDYIVFFEELDDLNHYQNNMLWTKKLKYALNNDNIVVYYQPLVNTQTSNVDKYECLVRMIDEDKVVAPFFFLDISKKANQYRNITKIVIDKAFKQFSGLPFKFSVNVSYEDIEDKYFLYYVENKIKEYDVASQVTWEILEDESIKDYNVLLNFTKKVKELGCSVSIDDFGTGYSNFEHLLKMDVDYLKIDASLVKNVAKDTNSFNIVKTIIAFAKTLNMKTVAEYVENEEIHNIVKELGATYSQGYYFSAPVESPKYKTFK